MHNKLHYNFRAQNILAQYHEKIYFCIPLSSGSGEMVDTLS